MVDRILYVHQSLGPDERIIHVGSYHWMYTCKAITHILFGILVCVCILWGAIYFQANYNGGFYVRGTLAQIQALHPGVKLLAFLSIVMGVLGFARDMVNKATTEIVITSKRLIYKRGLISRQVGEMSIDRIEGVNVLQSVMGRLLNYGRLMVRGMGVGEVVLPPLENPILFRKAIMKARSLEDDD
jgi:uncharacterized membrane protein YdbT with pleckstrin-like domain